MCDLVIKDINHCGHKGGGGIKMESSPSFCSGLGTIYIASF